MIKYFYIQWLTFINRHMYQIEGNGMFSFYQKHYVTLLFCDVSAGLLKSLQSFFYLMNIDFFTYFTIAKPTFLNLSNNSFCNPLKINDNNCLHPYTKFCRFLSHTFPFIRSVNKGNTVDIYDFTSLLIALSFQMYLW